MQRGKKISPRSVIPSCAHCGFWTVYYNCFLRELLWGPLQECRDQKFAHEHLRREMLMNLLSKKKHSRCNEWSARRKKSLRRVLLVNITCCSVTEENTVLKARVKTYIYIYIHSFITYFFDNEQLQQLGKLYECCFL